MRRWAWLAAAGVALALGSATPATAQAVAYSSFAADIEVRPDGSLVVTETVDVSYRISRHGIFRDIPVKYRYDPDPDMLRVLELDVLAVERAGRAEPYEVLREGDQRQTLRLKIGDPDVTVTGEQRYHIRYRVRGALNSFDSHEELFWNVTGGDWEGSFAAVAVRVSGPPITRSECYAGLRGASPACASGGHSGGVAEYRDEVLGSGGRGMTVVVGFPAGSVAVGPPILEERWTPLRVLALTPANVGSGAAALVASVALVVKLGRRGRDARALGGLHDGGAASPVDPGDAPVQFRPPEGLRPAHLGLLDDEIVHPVDVGATLLDLAVRGHFVLADRRSPGDRAPDWVVVLSEGAPRADDLDPFEERLLAGFRRHATVGEVRLSSLEGKFKPEFDAVADHLYDDAVHRGWFADRPDRVRNRWYAFTILPDLAGIGLVLLALTTRTKIGIPGVVLLLLGAALVFVARHAPAKTPLGTVALVQTRGFKRFIETAERDEMNYAAEQGEFVRFLPYAVAFGAVDAWVRAARGLDVAAATAGWYAGPSISSWDSFGTSVGAVGMSAGSSLSSPPASSGGSGFGGGGGGGGMGGGGGGSW